MGNPVMTNVRIIPTDVDGNRVGMDTYYQAVHNSTERFLVRGVKNRTGFSKCL